MGIISNGRQADEETWKVHRSMLSPLNQVLQCSCATYPSWLASKEAFLFHSSSRWDGEVLYVILYVERACDVVRHEVVMSMFGRMKAFAFLSSEKTLFMRQLVTNFQHLPKRSGRMLWNKLQGHMCPAASQL